MEHIDKNEALSKLGGSEKLFNILLIGFLIKHAKIDREILMHNKKEDFIEAARIAHSIKGLSMNMCAAELFEKAKMLEDEYLDMAQKSKSSKKNSSKAEILFKEFQDALREVEKDVKEYVVSKRVLHYDKLQYPESVMSELEIIDELEEALFGLQIDRLRVALYSFQELEIEGEAGKLYRKVLANIKELDFYDIIKMLEKLKELLEYSNE